MISTDKNYAGMDGFVWWMGIVESRSDPLNLGRCQIRIYGWHSPSLTDIPTEDLPWAHPVYPLNNNTFGTPKESDLVFGFFADGRNGQVPIMMGVLPTIPIEESKPDIGFNDVRTDSQLKSAPKRIQNRNYNSDGSGVEISEGGPLRYPTAGTATVPGLSRGQPDSGNPVSSRKDRKSIKIPTTGNSNVNVPASSYNPVYPYDKVIESESGHSLEMDDTPGSERVELNHRSGTYFEIQPDGTKIEEIVRDNYRIVMSDDHIYIMGNALVTVDSRSKIRTKGDVTIEVGKNVNMKVAGDLNVTATGDFKVRANQIKMESTFNTSVLSGFNTSITSSVGATNIRSLFGTNITSQTGGINLRAPVINSLGPFNFGTFSSEIADFAAPSELDELLPQVPAPEEILNQIPTSSLSEIEDTLSKVDSAALDAVLQGVDTASASKVIESLGDTFNAQELIEKSSNLGISGLIESADSLTIGNLITKIEEVSGESTLNELLNKVSAGEESIKNLTSKLNIDQLNKFVKAGDISNVNKLFDGLDTNQIRDIANNFDTSSLQKVVKDLSGDSIIKLRETLNSSEFAKVANSLTVDLKNKLTLPISELSGKFQVVQSSVSSEIAEAIASLPANLNLPIKDLASRLNIPVTELASKFNFPATDLASNISIPTVDLFSILEALDIESNFAAGDLAGSLLQINVG
jgi:hypothetical protein